MPDFAARIILAAENLAIYDNSRANSCAERNRNHAF
jgi:hypothetical protein